MSPLLVSLLAVLLIPLFVATWRTSLLGLALQGSLLAAIAYPSLRPLTSAVPSQKRTPRRRTNGIENPVTALMRPTSSGASTRATPSAASTHTVVSVRCR